MNRCLIALVLLLILSGCNKEEIVPPLITSRDGQISLKIDRVNAPQNVAVVTAYLTRSGYTTISNSLNLLTDTTADLTMPDIPVGPWHLKVDAEDTLGVVKYSGETDVTVLENQTIQIYLTLAPVPGGVGNIYLYVNWGTVPGIWIDYPANPVLTSAGSFEINGPSYQKVIFDENKYKMWYTGLNPGGVGYIKYAESTDGIDWVRPFNNPVLTPGYPGEWDDFSVLQSCILKDDNEYKMYYSGRKSHYLPWHIGLATSPDGINWTKHPVPVLYAGINWEYQVSPGHIIKKDGVYYLYYNGIIYDGTHPVPAKIGLATSSDGINFTKHTQNPVLDASQNWEGGYVMMPSVEYENGQFYMVYMNAVCNAFGEAFSADGITWTKSTLNPVFKSINTYNHWTDWIGFPSYVKVNDDERIYYMSELPGYICSVGLLKKN